MFDSRWDADLDEAQLAAVTHDDSPLVVVAGAGTGKTRTLTSRVACLLDRGVVPERILLLTFTRRAAQDMISRAGALSPRPDAGRRMWGGTFHAIAHRLVTEFAATLGLEQVSVLDPADVSDLIDLLRDEHGLAADPNSAHAARRLPRAGAIADIYSRAVNTNRPARDVIATDFPWCQPHADQILNLLKAFMARKRAGQVLDFDDLLIAWRALLEAPAIAQRLVERFDHVLVDEYQDLNQVQVQIVEAMRPGGQGLTVVGDDAQAIYGFRGASSGHLLDVAQRYGDADVVRLERNFRSRQPVLDLANVVRPGADKLILQAHRTADRAAKPRLVNCYDTPEEAREVAQAVLAAVELGEALRDHAVLMRSGSHSDLLELELTARRIPFVKYGGLKFLEAAHVKDFLAMLRLIGNERDEVAWFRLLRLHDGIGPARAATLLRTLLAQGDGGANNDVVAAAPARARTAVGRTLTALSQARANGSVSSQVEVALAALTPLIERRYVDAAPRHADLERLAQAATATGNLRDFVAELTLDPPASTSDFAQPPHLDEDYLTLSTIHSAKGLEWDNVHLIHAVDGAFPSDMALGSTDGLAEEERLFYVAVTRARDTLSIYTPLRMPHHPRARDDKHSYAVASRFITDAARAVLEEYVPPRAQASAVAGGAVPEPVALPSLSSLFD